jgi:hypothetical protein
MKNIIAICLLALLSSGAFAQNQTVSQIKTKWNQLKPKAGVKVYEREPSATPPYNAGRLALDYTNNGKNTLNFVRYLAGLPAVDSHSYNLQCQAGALVLAANGDLSHNPPQPKGMGIHDGYETGYNACTQSNIYMSTGNSATLEQAIKSWLNDSDPSNIKSLGHRRWLLNPPMKNTGFGRVTNPGKGTFITMWAFDKSGKGKKDRVLWPNEGNFPSDFFDTNHAWSISLNSAVYSNTAANTANISVKLTCLNNNKVWTFTKADTSTSGKFFNISTDRYGMDFCIVFRPDGIASFGNGSNKYRVEVTGLKGANNATLPKMVYDVEFFSL